MVNKFLISKHIKAVFCVKVPRESVILNYFLLRDSSTLKENRRKNDRELQWKHRIQREVAELKSRIETALLQDSQLYTVLQVHPQLGNIHNSN